MHTYAMVRLMQIILSLTCFSVFCPFLDKFTLNASRCYLIGTILWAADFSSISSISPSCRFFDFFSSFANRRQFWTLSN